jgi:hypothetical protein
MARRLDFGGEQLCSSQVPRGGTKRLLEYVAAYRQTTLAVRLTLRKK